MRKIKKYQTVEAYLGDVMTRSLKIVLKNYSLNNVTVEQFVNKFGEMTREEMKTYILNGENACEISMFGYRTSELNEKGNLKDGKIEVEEVDMEREKLVKGMYQENKTIERKAKEQEER